MSTNFLVAVIGDISMTIRNFRSYYSSHKPSHLQLLIGDCRQWILGANTGILGRQVARLLDTYVEPGYYQAQWNDIDAGRGDLPSGIYIALLVTAEYTKSIKMVLLR